MTAPIFATFAFQDTPARYRVEAIRAVRGEPLRAAAYMDVYERNHLAQSLPPAATSPLYTLRGTTGHVRYVTRSEKQTLSVAPPVLGRPEATRASLIPIRKTDAWWELAQDQRREILEERSRHISIGLAYVPAIARRLYHGRELGEPFDFVTWFEYAPSDVPLFAALLAALRATEEWNYVEREVQVDLVRA
jgi:hypothetical protein